MIFWGRVLHTRPTASSKLSGFVAGAEKALLDFHTRHWDRVVF
jgi:hypothetical protein